ncbi:hypothetical protein GJ496_001815 [Pomphorhynchus laevis]|nr:hypothetical protein GJ496_001815 [Pomphorhynchus laevis]
MLSPQFQTQHYEQQLQFDNLRYHQNPNPYFFSQLQNQYNYHHINQNKNDDVGDNSSGDLCVSDDTYFEPIVTTDNISNNSSNTIKKNRHFTALSAAVSTPSIAATVANKINKESEDDDYAIKQLASSLHMEDSSPSMPSDFSIEHINKSSSGTITASAADTANLIMNGVTTASVEVACKNGSSENCGLDVSDRAIDNTTYFNSGNCYLSNNNCDSGGDCNHFLDEINLKTTRLLMNSTRRQLRLQSQNRHHHPQNDTRQHNLQQRKQATVHASSNFVSSNRVLPSSALASKSSHISSLLSPPLLSATTSMIVPSCLQQNNQNRYKNLLLKDNNKSMHTMDSKITTSCQSSMESNLYTTANTVADAANINLGTISYNHNNNKNTRDLLLSSSSPVTSVAAAVVSTRMTKITTSSPLLLYHDDPSNSMIISDEYFTTNPDGINISDDGDIGGNGFCGFTGNMIKKKRRCSPNSTMVDQQQQQMQQMYHRRHGVLASNMVSTSIELIPRYTANCSPVISTQHQNDSATSTAVNATDFITNNNNSHDNNSSVCDDGYGDDCGGGNIADGCFTTSNKTKDDPFSEIYGNSNNPKECRCRLRAMVMCLRCGSLCHSDCISTDSLCSDCVDKICVVVVRSEYES